MIVYIIISICDCTDSGIGRYREKVGEGKCGNVVYFVVCGVLILEN